MSEERESMESLLARVTERRRELLTSVVDRRTRHFCMVLEDLFDPHNISAVIRTAEVFGLQDVHIIEEDNAYSVNKSILKGSYKWMSLYLYKKRMLCMEKLRAKGYKIAVASTNTTNSVLDLDLSQPTAFYLGSEFHGNHGGVLMTYLDVFMQKEGREKFLLKKEERDALLWDWLDRHVNGIENNSPITRVEE